MNKNFISLVPSILSLQTNLFLKSANSLVDNFQFDIDIQYKNKNTDKIFSVKGISAFGIVNNNFQICTDPLFVNRLDEGGLESKNYMNIIKRVMEQIIILLAFLEVLGDNLNFPQIIIVENLIEMLGHCDHVLSYSRRNNSRGKSSLHRMDTNQINLETEDGLKQYNERLETRMNEMIDLIHRCELDIDLEELRR